jgi:hypothetical protein
MDDSFHLMIVDHLSFKVKDTYRIKVPIVDIYAHCDKNFSIPHLQVKIRYFTSKITICEEKTS